MYSIFYIHEHDKLEDCFIKIITLFKIGVNDNNYTVMIRWIDK
jgi:hypothetical protein